MICGNERVNGKFEFCWELQVEGWYEGMSVRLSMGRMGES